ncbi:MAG: PilZ domain-containing protein [Myxococcaceae bacterium]
MLAQTDAVERRRSPRFVAAGVFAHLCHQGRSFPCHVHNVSAGGLSVLSRERVGRHSDVALNLAMKGWTRVLTVRGRILDDDGPTVRIALYPLADEAAELFDRLLQQLDATSAKPPPPRLWVPPPPEREEQEASELEMELEGLRGRVRALERALQDEVKRRESAEIAVDRLATELAHRR